MLPSGKAAATSRFQSASGSPSRRSSRPAYARQLAPGVLVCICIAKSALGRLAQESCGGGSHLGYMHKSES